MAVPSRLKKQGIGERLSRGEAFYSKFDDARPNNSYRSENKFICANVLIMRRLSKNSIAFLC